MRSIPPELLRRVPGCEAGNPAQGIDRLAGGRGVNSVWRVRTPAGDYVLRLRHEPVHRPGSAADFELAAHRIAAKAGLAPKLLDAAPDGRWLLMEYIEAPMLREADLLTDGVLDALGQVLQTLHGLDCSHLPRMDVPGIARGSVEVIVTRRSQRLAEAAAVQDLLQQQVRELAGRTDRAVLNHGDLMVSNLVGAHSPGGLRLVDWEYAQRADPTWDMACLLAYYPSLEARLGRLLDACGLPTAADREILSLQRQVFEGLDRLWRLAEEGNWIS